MLTQSFQNFITRRQKTMIFHFNILMTACGSQRILRAHSLVCVHRMTLAIKPSSDVSTLRPLVGILSIWVVESLSNRIPTTGSCSFPLPLVSQTFIYTRLSARIGRQGIAVVGHTRMRPRNASSTSKCCTRGPIGHQLVLC